MRPKLLEIEGLQSFRNKQVINFDDVSDTGLFGIFGPTGSGKSTILDAITLALYGKIKRAEGGTQGIINTQCETARVSFTFELLKHGSQTAYIVERTYQKKKNSPASCEAKIARLIEINNGTERVLSDKATEVSNKVKELIGLSHEDFMRAVVLPQNTFHEFLLLGNKERRQMLERIFYLEEYGTRLQEKLGRKMSEIRSLIDKLEGELSGYEDANTQALEKAKCEYDMLSVEQKKVNNQFEEIEKEYNRLKQVWDTISELSILKDRQNEILSQNEFIEEIRTKYENSVRANELIEEVKRVKQLIASIEEKQIQLQQHKEMLPNCETLYLSTKQKYENIRQEAYENRPVLFERKAKLEEAYAIQKEIEEINKQKEILIEKMSWEINKLDEYARQKNYEIMKMKEYENKLISITEQSEKLKVDAQYRHTIHQGIKIEEETELLQNDIKNDKDKIQTAGKELFVLNNKLKEVHCKIESIVSEINAKTKGLNNRDNKTIHEQIQALNDAKSIVTVIKHLEKEIKDLNDKRQNIQDSILDFEKEERALRNLADKQNEFCLTIKREENEIITKINGHSAVILAASLEKGKPCPVCGSVEHPAPALSSWDGDFEMLNHELEQCKNEHEMAQNNLKNYEKKLSACEQKLKISQESLRLIENEINIKTQNAEQQKNLLPEDLRDVDVFEAETNINARSSELMNILSQLEKLEKEKNKYLVEKSSIAAEINIKTESLNKIHESLSKKMNRLTDVNQSYMDFIKKTNIDSARKEFERISENDKKLEEIEAQISEFQKMIQQNRANIEELNQQYNNLLAEKINIEAQLNNCVLQLQQKNTRINLLCYGLQNNEVGQAILKIEEQLKKYEEDENLLRQQLENLEKELNETRNNIAIGENQLKIYDESLRKETQALEIHLLQRGFSSIADVENNVMKPDDIANIKKQIDEYDRQVFDIKANIERMQNKLGDSWLTESEWEEANRTYCEMKIVKEDIMRKFSVAADNYERIKNKHKRWIQLNKLYKDYKHKYGLYEIIQKLLKAEHRKDNSFIDFIAEERLRYIAVKATQILGEMTKYRYVLEIGINGEFIIRDNINGGIARNVASLSGGETFMTSLSLALALSEQIQLKGLSPLEFFFLDEGFGTLDGDTLDYVIESLQKTSRKNRVIGIISHVPEIRARMERRLIVRPPAADCGSTVRVEKA